MKKGLVMEGGAMRGMFTAGVIDVMLEHQITFDGAMGVSAGSVFGCNYKSNQPGRVIRYNAAYCNKPQYAGLRTFLKTGDMFGAEFCYHEIPEELDIFDFETYEKSPMEFYAVCTDIETGKPVYHRCDKLDDTGLEWLRASASMPMASRIVEIAGRKLLDGGISDSIPLRFMEKAGYEKNVVVLTQPRSYTKGKNKLMPVMKITLKKYPDFIKTMENRHKMYNGELKYFRKAESEGRAFVIAPTKSLPVRRVEHNPKALLEVYRMGRNCANQQLDALKLFLKK